MDSTHEVAFLWLKSNLQAPGARARLHCRHRPAVAQARRLSHSSNSAGPGRHPMTDYD